MKFIDIYDIGRTLQLEEPSIESWDEKLRFVEFPYRSAEIIWTSLILFLALMMFNLLVQSYSTFFSYVSVFLAFSSAIVAALYPVKIYYAHEVGAYKEQMLLAIMRLSTYITMDSSIEYAVVKTTPELKGILRRQFEDILERMRREKKTLGELFEEYIPIWNQYNPVYVKSLRLLQTASLAAPDEREEIVNETIETLLWNHTTMGKRFAENLSNNAKQLIMIGVLMPVMTLMLLPMVTIFLPDLVSPSIISFVYIVLFPVLTLIFSLNFAAQRVQVTEIRLEDAAQYEPMNPYIKWVLGAIVFALILISLQNVLTIAQTGSTYDESVLSIVPAWLASAGLAGAVLIYSYLYTAKYKDLYNDIKDVEDDLPHLLQSFSTYLSLNMPMEKIVDTIRSDYKDFGMGQHAVIQIFQQLKTLFLTTKQTFKQLIHTKLPDLVPSKKVTNILQQIVSFADVSQESSAKAAKMIREQTLSVSKLDDYMQTLLSDTTSLINITTSLLAPLLSAAAVLIGVAIVKALVFMENQLSSVGQAFGIDSIDVQFIDTSSIIPPQLMEFVIGLYLVETIIILTFFATVVNIGNDKYQLMKRLRSNMTGFFVYSGILFGGYIVIQTFFQATFA